MDLWQYFNILRRSWWLVLGLPVLVGLLTVLLWLFGPASYEARVAVLVTQQPLATNEPNVTLPDYNNFNSWAASEYVVDDLLQIVGTRRFALDITAWIKQNHNVDLDPLTVQEGLDAERKHRTLFLEVVVSQPDHALWIADGAVAMLEEKGLAYWNRNDTGELDVSLLERPEEAERVGGVIGLVLDLVIRMLLALLLAIGLAFLLHYLDRSIRQRNDVEALGLEVIGTIPVSKGANA